MANVLIVAHLLIVVALIGVILLQRSEGGGLGMGSNSNGLMSVRGSANLLTRTTAILAALFFATSVGLTIISEFDNRTSGILAGAADSADSTLGEPTSVLDALNALEPTTDDALSVPAAPEAPASEDADPALTVPAPAAETPAATDAPVSEAPAATEAPAAVTEAPSETTETPAASSGADQTTPTAPTN